MARFKYDLIESYMIVGGIPYYLDYFKRGKSLAQNIDSLFFCRNAKLESEFIRLFASLFINPDDYMKVVKLLVKRHIGFTRDEIVEKLGFTSGGSFSKMLETLVASDFISSYHPIHLTLVTTLGLKHNAHSGIFQKVVTMSELLD